MINGRTTRVVSDGWMVRHGGEIKIFASKTDAEDYLDRSSLDHVVQLVRRGQIIPFHHHENSYYGYQDVH